ncbi:MAG: hypothetical protein Q4G68_00080 [Planctomycetia bacterium]|nr:hypothetical protein [Planctomycetia bacterium]
MKLRWLLLATLALFVSATLTTFAEESFAPNEHMGADEAKVNIYVSKLGDDSDGKSWQTAYKSVQKALLSIPDDKGGYRIVVRPDTYMEANLYPSHKGAKDAYNELVGDFDGKYGSGAVGWVVLDSSDPEKGYQSYDWYSSIRAYTQGWTTSHTDETFSSLGWDRWIVRRLYVTGSDAGLFWDCLDDTGPFTVVVEDCISIGRAFGIGVAFAADDPANPHARPDEPTVFRRTWAASLDTWGDAGAAFLRAFNSTLPEYPDFYLEDCTLVSPDNAIENNCDAYPACTYVSLKNCRLIVNNFSQPGGTPCTGIIRSANGGEKYKVAFEDCSLMGCKVFSEEADVPIQYELKGHNKVYLQYKQTIPEGFEGFSGWPIDLFHFMAPPLE